MLLRTAVLLAFTACPALAETYPFEGDWSCDVGPLSFNSETYQGEPIQSIEPGVPGDWLITMADGYSFALMDVTDTELTWSSPSSGDTASCQRAGALAAAPASSPTPAPRRWTGQITGGQVEASIGSPEAEGAGMSFACSSGQYGRVSVVWPGNEPTETLRVSVDGGEYKAYPIQEAGTLSMNEPGYTELVTDLIHGNLALVIGADERVWGVSLAGSGQFMSACELPAAVRPQSVGLSGATAPAGDLEAWIGKSPWHVFQDPVWRDTLVGMLGQETYDEMNWTIQVSNGMERYGDWVSGDGCRPHMCNDEWGAIAFNLKDRRVVVVEHSDGEPTNIHGEDHGDLPPPIMEALSR